MKKILMIADGITMAHVTRMEQLANQIDRTRFEIHFAAPKSAFSILDLNSPRKFHLYEIDSVANQLFIDRLYKMQFPWRHEELNQQLQQNIELIQQVRPDLVIGDTRLSLTVACKKTHTPYLNLMNFHWNPLYERPLLVPHSSLAQLFGRNLSQIFSRLVTPLILKRQKNYLNQWLKSVQSTEVESIYHFYSQGDLLLFPDLAENFADQTRPTNGEFIGPLIWRGSQIPWPKQWENLNPNEKYAMVSMGSSGFTGLIPSIIEGLNELGYVALLSGSNKAIGDIKKYKVHFADFFPMDAVLNKCLLAIGNGGTSTTYHFQSKGLHFYSIPTNLDQYLNVDRLRHLKISDYQDISEFSVKSFINKVDALLKSNETAAQLKHVKSLIEQTESENKINSILNSKF